ncbi:MAG: hypothetical protein ACLPYB_03250 [Desulfobaccales bacterium]
MEYDFYSKNILGFFLSEKFDFGSAKNINNIFYDLLRITPFPKDDIIKYDQLLNDRNLLVHHAGIYTTKYHRHVFVKKRTINRIFYDSFIVRKKDFKKWATFINNITIKINDISRKALAGFIVREKIKLLKENEKAFDYLEWTT